MSGKITSGSWMVWVGVLKLVVAAVTESVDNAEAEGAAFVGTRVVGESPSMVALDRLQVDHCGRTDLTMATTNAAKDDDDDQQTTSTTSLPPTTTTTTTTATTQPQATPNKFKDLPPDIQDRQSSGGDESTLCATPFNPAEPSTSTLFLPLPNPSTNKSRSSFVLSEDGLPPEIANADISIASESPFYCSLKPCRITRGNAEPRLSCAFSRLAEQSFPCYATGDFSACAVLGIFPATCTDHGPSGSKHTGCIFLLHLFQANGHLLFLFPSGIDH